MTCGRCGCAITAERKKGRGTSTTTALGFAGLAARPHTCEAELSRLFADVVRRVQIPADIADWIANGLRESLGRQRAVSSHGVGQLHQRYAMRFKAKLDRAYEDRLAVHYTPQMWSRKSQEWEA